MSMEIPEDADDPFLDDYKEARALLRTSDWRSGLERLEELAHKGSISSILLVADAMRVGWLYRQDLATASLWYQAAIEAGYPRGLFGLGLAQLAKEEFDSARGNLEKAGAQGYWPAFNSLAGIYFRGDGVPVDRKKAEMLWKKASSYGHVPARKNLLDQRLAGSYGAWGKIKGLLGILPYAIRRVHVARTDPYSDAMR